MAFHTFGPGLALDRVTMAPLPAVVASLEDAETGEPVQAFSVDDESLPVLVATNRYGYFGQFKVPAEVRRLRLTFAGLTLEHTAWELIPAALEQAVNAADDAELAKIAAQQAAALVAAPADTVVKTLIQGTSTLTRQALDALYMGKGTLGLATPTADGLMPKADKAKLDGLGGLATSAKDGLMPKADKAKLDNSSSTFGGANSIVQRNADGNVNANGFFIPAGTPQPNYANSMARKDYVDAGLAKQFSYNGLVPAGTINGLLTPGVYYQSNSVEATIANGYPWNSSSGTLIIYFYAGSTTYIVQEWIAASDGRRAFRSTGNGGTTWRPWNEMARIQDVASMIGAQLGNVVNTDELTASVFIPTFAGQYQGITAGAINTLLVAPYDLRVTKIMASFENLTLPASSTNHLTLTLRGYNPTSGGRVIVAKSSADDAITARKPWLFDALSWNETNAVIPAGDAVNIGWGLAGTAQLSLPMTVQIGYEPL